MFLGGVLTALGVCLVLWKLPLWFSMRLLGRHFWLDIALTVGVYSLVGPGTYSGAIAAAIAGICISITTSVLRTVYGYVVNDIYYPGWIRLELDELRRPKPFNIG